MKSLLSFIISLTLAGLLFQCSNDSYPEYTEKTETRGKYPYKHVTNDPLNARIYTLPNGLTVYLSRNTATPRVYTSIAVKAGGKFDPNDATGLAHYLEHIMFKGTPDYGTLNWEDERVLLDSIELMFEHYRTLTDDRERQAYYKKIDVISGKAAQYAIANEYDKMMAEIGVQKTNAYTTADRTVYIGDVPANQIENWLTVEGNRFRYIIPRLFHTELEAVYEEKNRILDSDDWKVYLALLKAAFKQHPYGTQSIIGTIEHLKNPSITEIKKYFTSYYCPNNVAICLSGDLNYDKTIALIDKTFGEWTPNPSLQPWDPIIEDSITNPQEMVVKGPEAESVTIAFRFDGTASPSFGLLKLTDLILSNAQAGLIDLNLIQKQSVLNAYSYIDDMNDYSLHVLTGYPREGQSLQEVKDLLLEQINLLKQGEFENWLVEAIVNNVKKDELEEFQHNSTRVNEMVVAFTNNIPWVDYVQRTPKLSSISKNDVVQFANKYYGDNYITIYKQNEDDPNVTQVVKPAITQVTLNKEAQSSFHQQILSNKPEKIEPEFLDYTKDISILKLNEKLRVLHVANTENDLFELYYYLPYGTVSSPILHVAANYFNYLGTGSLSPEEVKKEFYKLGCSYGLKVESDQTYAHLSGLNKNMDKAIALFDQLLNSPSPNQEGLKNLIKDILKQREDNKKDKKKILFSGLMNYGLYGAKNPFTSTLTNKEVRQLTPDQVIDVIKSITQTEHQILYYGPQSTHDLLASLEKGHKIPDTMTPLPKQVELPMQTITTPTVYYTHYDMVQEEILFLSKGDLYDPEQVPCQRLFNEYFGGNMSSPVFQELRESRGLAYAAFATCREGLQADRSNYFFAYVGTQADKQPEAMSTMKNLIEHFPYSESGFEVARQGLINQIESERIIRSNILFDYLQANNWGISYDIRKEVYSNLKTLTLEDVDNFHKSQIAGRKQNVVLIGDKEKFNYSDLMKYGTLKELTLDEVFGYEPSTTEIPVSLN